MADLISQLAARGWLLEDQKPIDVTHADWARVSDMLAGRISCSRTGVARKAWPAITAAQKVVVDVLTAQGAGCNVIGARLGVHPRTIERIRLRPVVGQPDRMVMLLFGWERPGRPRIEVQAGQLRSAS